MLEPASGRLTGADSGVGRLPEPAEIFAAAVRVLARGAAGLRQDLAGRKVVVSAGGTREELDPVRFLGNWSSGRQGYAFAATAVARGAKVTLVAANVALPDPAGPRVVTVISAREMRDAMLAEAADADAVVMAAAVADFRPEVRSEAKIKKDGSQPAPIILIQNPDILAELAARRSAAVGSPYPPHDAGVPLAPHEAGAPYPPHEAGAPYPPHETGAPPAPHDAGALPGHHGRARSSSASLRRPNWTWPAAGLSSPGRAATCSLSTGSETVWPSGPVTMRPWSSAPTDHRRTSRELPRRSWPTLYGTWWRPGCRSGRLLLAVCPVPFDGNLSTLHHHCGDHGYTSAERAMKILRARTGRKGSLVARRLFTSESVTEGHPDKMADQISDAILDAMIKDDTESRVAVETLITTGQVHVAGEVTTRTYVDIPGIIREKILEIGYDSSAKGFDGASCGVSVSIGSQSPDIALGVDDAYEYREGEGTEDLDRQGAGDQGLMFGYACRETPELMPLPIMVAHQLSRQLSAVRRSGTVPYLRPDGKTQVTVEYSGITPVRLDTVVVSTQHAPDINLKELLAPDIKDYVVDPVVGALELDTSNYRLLVNPTGRFEVGGPMGDAGLTGRKIIIDTYGGMARHGGGAFSGKDPSKVDRSAAYAMRWVAKNVVAAGLADRCETQVAYAIGKAKPVGLFVECFGTEKVPVERIEDAVLAVFDLRPRAIISALDLQRPIYSQTATFGHFGRTEPDFSWERAEPGRAAPGRGRP